MPSNAAKRFPAASLALVAALAGVYYLGFLQGRHSGDTARATRPANQLQTGPAAARPARLSAAGQVPGAPSHSANDRDLFDEVGRLQDSLQQLSAAYERLQQESARAGLSEAERAALPALIQDGLDQLPLPLLLPRIEAYTKIPRETLDSVWDQRAFVKRLTDVALNDILVSPEEPAEPLLGPVTFSGNPGFDGPRERFSQAELVVFAEFDSISFDRPEVLVKWFRIGDGRVFLFEQMPIRPNQGNHVWLKNENGMEPGLYQVDIYEVSQEMPLLSSGQYQVHES